MSGATCVCVYCGSSEGHTPDCATVTRPWAPSLGRVAFEAYTAKRGGKNHDGSPTPAWEELGDGVRAGWEAAARAVHAHVGRELLAELGKRLPAGVAV